MTMRIDHDSHSIRSLILCSQESRSLKQWVRKRVRRRANTLTIVVVGVDHLALIIAGIRLKVPEGSR